MEGKEFLVDSVDTPSSEPCTSGNESSSTRDLANKIVAVNFANPVAEADRLSNDSPMFSDPCPQEQDTLANSSSSEDAFKSLEKLENLARLAENAALEDRDIDTPQSFVNAEDGNDVDVADDSGAVDVVNSAVLAPPSAGGNATENSVLHEGIDDSITGSGEDLHATDARPELVGNAENAANVEKTHPGASEGEQEGTTDEGFEKKVAGKPRDCEEIEADGKHRGNSCESSNDQNDQQETKSGESSNITSCEQQLPEEQQHNQISTNGDVTMATSCSDGNRPASPVHEARDDSVSTSDNGQIGTTDTGTKSNSQKANNLQEPIETKSAKENDSDVVPDEESELAIEVSDLPQELPPEPPSVAGKRQVIIEDEQTGSVTVSYGDGDEFLRVELNDSSGDEFSDVEETEEQRILRESGAQIIEDDDDDDEEEEVPTVGIQMENNTRESVIHPRVATELKTSNNSRSESSTPKFDEPLQKRKESKLEQSIRKISNIREKENGSETAQLETISSITDVVQNGNRTNLPLTVKHNIRDRGSMPSVLTAREAAVTLIESDSESEMVIDERPESEKIKQQRKGVSRKRNRPESNQGVNNLQSENVKILGTVQILDNEPTELCTVPVGNATNNGKESGIGRSSTGPITIEPIGSLSGPPPLISDDVVITSVKQNGDTTAFKATLQIKQEKEDSGYSQYQQFIKHPVAPPPYRPPISMTQRQPIGINLSTGEPVYNAASRAVGGGMMRGPVSHPSYSRLPTPPAYAAPRPLRIRHNISNTSQYNNPLHGMSNIVMSQGSQPRMSQALVNVVMPGAPINSGPRPGYGPHQHLHQPSLRIMGPSFTNTTTVPVQILNTSVTSGNANSKTVTVVIPSKGSPGNSSSAAQNKAVTSVPKGNSPVVVGSKKVGNMKVPPAGISNVGFIKKLSLELPTYSPPSPPEKLSLNSVPQHTCAGCQDKFVSKSSLDWHRARQSMLLTFTCRLCQKHITFSNKCALLSHISSHGIFYQAVEKALNEGNLVIKTLHTQKNGKNVSVPAPVSLPGPTTSSNDKSNQHNNKESGNSSISKSIAMDPEFSKLIEKSKEIRQATQQKMSAEISGSKNTEVKANSNNKPITNSKDVAVKRKEIKILPKPGSTSVKPAVDRAKLQCAECGKHVPHHAALKAHFNTPPEDGKQIPACRNKFCNMILPTVCARDAHERYTHFQGSKPHVCPECGIECGNNLKVFRKHLSQICFHLCRAMVYCCPKCSYLTKFAEQIVEHAVDAHGEKYHKCQQCPMAFKSRSTFVNHCKNSHNFDDGGNPNADLPPHKAIFKCPMCDTVFHKYQQLQDHLVQHYPDTKKVQRLGYQCPRCEKLLRGNKSQLTEHLKSTHNVTDFVTHMCHICGRVCANENEKDIHIIQAHPDTVSGVPPARQTDSQSPPKKNNEQKESKPAEEKVDTVANKPVLQERITIKKPPVLKPGPASSKKRSISPASSIESASSTASKPTKRRASSPVVELVTGARNAGQRTLCNRCGIRFESDVDYTKHMRIHESRKRAQTDNRKGAMSLKKPKQELPDEKTNVSKLQVEVEQEPPRVPCPDCDAQFMTEEEREKHMQSKHAQVRQFPCQLCGLTYRKQVQLDHHVQTVHEGKVKECVYTCWICLEKNVHKSYQKRALLESHLKSVHKIPRNQIDFSKMPESQLSGASEDGTSGVNGAEETGDNTEVKRLRVDGDQEFNCAKCNFTCKDREEFQTHITKHKSIEEDALQCHECGMSFMVLPSLKRHLFMVHKIRNLKKYQEEAGINLEASLAQPELRPVRTSRHAIQNGYSSRESDSARDSETEHDGGVMECNVCYKEFENEGLLRKHMRMHGMAFIRSRRLDPAST